jgi:hypothetical protein
MSTDPTNLGTLVIGGGFAVAFAFGLVAAKTNFCTMGALSDIVNMGHWGRMRMWLLAVAVAIIGTTALSASGLVDLAKSVPQRPVLPWLSLLWAAAAVRRGHDACRWLRQQEPGAPGRRQRALAGGAGLHGPSPPT